ncbi:MAG: glycosidase, partial [Deltaproteobacteria bacterium]|nr:glycosidase [Deltaproteobacteria bacterium]
DAIDKVREKYPSFIFIAEAYWDLEWRLQELGFDYTYDKKLYDLLLYAPARRIHEHLLAGETYQRKSVRFIENHDEPRAVTAFGRERLAAAAVVAATVPGMHFFHEGQQEGLSRRLPVQLKRRLEESPDSTIQLFYKRLLDYINHELIHSGTWELMNPSPAWETNQTYRNLLAWIWYKKNRFRLIVVNYSNEHSQCNVYLPQNLIQKNTMVFHDCLSDASYAREPSDLVKYGLYIDLLPWQAHLFEIESY